MFSYHCKRSFQYIKLAPVCAPWLRNIPYGRAFIRSIYETRRPDHPHLSILRYKWLPQGSTSRPHYMESWSAKDLWSTSTSTPMSTPLSSLPTLQFLHARHHHVNSPSTSRISYQTRALSLTSEFLRWPPFPTWFNLLFLTWFNSLFSTAFDSFLNSFQLAFNVFIFNLSHIIWVPFQSSFRESHMYYK